MTQRGPGTGQYPPVRFFQALLGDASKWALTDASGVLNTRTDGVGFTDFLTTATIGIFYLTRPITDYLGGPIGAGTRIISGVSLVRHISGAGSLDEYMMGFSDNADPTAGGAKWEVGGIKSSSGLWKPHTGDEASAASGGPSFTAADPYGFYPMLNIAGRSESSAHAFLYDGTTFRGTRINGLAVRAFTPTHLVVRVSQLSATIQTHRIGVGFMLYPSVPDLTITARV